MELCCSLALMAGLFGCSNQNNGLNLPCRSSGTGTISCRLSIYMSTELLMALKGATWPSDTMSLFGAHDRNKSPFVGSRDHSLCGIIAGIRAVIALDRHSCLFTPAIWSGCWFFVASQPSACGTPVVRVSLGDPHCLHGFFVLFRQSACCRFVIRRWLA